MEGAPKVCTCGAKNENACECRDNKPNQPYVPPCNCVYVKQAEDAQDNIMLLKAKFLIGGVIIDRDGENYFQILFQRLKDKIASKKLALTFFFQVFEHIEYETF